MKKTLVLVCLSATYVHTGFYTPPQGAAHETVAQARKRFQCMSVRQMYHLDVCTLREHEIKAFQELAQTLFRREVASVGCFSQANRRKYEVMYQKNGELHACRKKQF